MNIETTLEKSFVRALFFTLGSRPDALKAMALVYPPWTPCHSYLKVPRPCGSQSTPSRPPAEWKTRAAATVGGTLAALLQSLRRAPPAERRRRLREANVSQLRIIAVGLQLTRCADEQRMLRKIAEASQHHLRGSYWRLTS